MNKTSLWIQECSSQPHNWKKIYISSSFLNINCQYPGSTHDAFIFANSQMNASWSISQRLVGFLGTLDILWGITSWLPLTQQPLFNNAHTRNVVEKAFGVLKSRFRYLCLYKFNYHLLYLISITVIYCTFEWKKNFYDIYLLIQMFAQQWRVSSIQAGKMFTDHWDLYEASQQGN